MSRLRIRSDYSVARARDLPEHSRRLITLRELKGLSYQELADTLRVPIGTVMSRLSRARQTVRRTLTP
jgi:RNA polymerase sigma-70 factor (ECF subfamily)